MKEKFNILLIEPDPKLADRLKGWLNDLAEISHVPDFQYVENGCWDLVIADAHALTMNNLHITQWFKRNHPETGVLILAENVNVDYILDAMHHHADGLMFKPVRKNEFTARVLLLCEAARANRIRAQKVILAIGAHPDDVEIGCAGTLARRRTEGAHLYILTMSHGEEGGNPLRRKAEAQAAANAQGAHLFIADFKDREITISKASVNFIEHIIEEIKPTHVYTHSLHDSHQDHRNVAQASIIAARKIENVFSYQSPSATVDFKPNVFIDIHEFMDKKIQFLNMFTDQAPVRPYMQPEMIRAVACYWGRFCNYRYCEPFEIIKTDHT